MPDPVRIPARGKVTAKDYEDVLVPALEAALDRYPKVRFLYVLDDAFEGYSGGAAWEDAKVGLKHFRAFERIAVVSDVEGLTHAVRAFGFLMPGEVRVFGNAEESEARAWIQEKAGESAAPASVSSRSTREGSLTLHLRSSGNVFVLEPHGGLDATDFTRIAEAVDPTIEKTGGLRGLMIVAQHFPGWDDLAAFVSHVRFVKDHHKKIRRVAFVTEDRFLHLIPKFASHFVSAEVRAFPMGEREDALSWLSE